MSHTTINEGLNFGPHSPRLATGMQVRLEVIIPKSFYELHSQIQDTVL